MDGIMIKPHKTTQQHIHFYTTIQNTNRKGESKKIMLTRKSEANEMKTIFISNERMNKKKKQKPSTLVGLMWTRSIAYIYIYIVVRMSFYSLCMWTRYMALSVSWNRQMPEPHATQNKNFMNSIHWCILYGIFHYFPCLKQIASSSQTNWTEKQQFKEKIMLVFFSHFKKIV